MHTKKTNRVFGVVIPLILLSLLLALAFTVGRSILPLPEINWGSEKENLRHRVEAGCDEDESFTSVGNYLAFWRFPEFSQSKLDVIETVFRERYYKDLPKLDTLAKDTALLYLENLYDTTDRENLEANTDAIVTAYVKAIGDTYAVYRTAGEAQSFTTDMSGNYVGIGVTVHRDTIANTLTITSVTPDSPAYLAGILPNDQLYAVNGVSVDDAALTEVTSLVSGEVGTTLTVTILRDGEKIDLTMTRQALTAITVSYQFDEETKLGYIRITQFKDNTQEQFREAIDILEEKGAIGYIFDVRSNPGGKLNSVVRAISYITQKDTEIVSFGGYTQPMYDTDDHTVNKPLVILTNGSTASAGELFTAALREAANAIVIGETTYGKGVMQVSYGITDGSSITLTVAQYNPPSGINYDGVGVVPDIEIKNDGETDKQLEYAEQHLRKLANS